MQSPPPPQPLNFRCHCIFCLQLQPPGVIVEVIKKNSKNIKDFQPILNYLTGTDPTFFKGKQECLKRGLPILGNIPPMCEKCYEMMGKLNRLHELLLNLQTSIQKQTELIREKIKETLPDANHPQSRRKEFNDRMASSGMPREQISRSCDFICNLHNAIISEGKNRVIYPSRPPPTTILNQKGKARVPAAPSAAVAPKPAPVASTSSLNAIASKRIGILNRKSINLVENPTATTSVLPSSSSPLHSRRNKRKDSLLVTRRAEVITVQPSSSSFSNNSDLKYENENSSDNDDNDDDAPIDDPLASLEATYSNSEEEEEKFSLLKQEEDEESAAAGNQSKKRKRTFHSPSKSKKLRASRAASRCQKCDLCGKRYRISDIAKHLKTHVKNYVTKCLNPSCQLHFSCHQKMKNHLRRSKQCQMKIKMKLPKYPQRKCNFCDDFPAGNFSCFRVHMKQHEDAIQEKNFPCPIPGCSKIFALKEYVEIHINQHNLRPPPTHQKCFVCKNEIKIPEMEAHLKEAHEITEFVACKFCKFLFPNRKAIIEHIYEHRDDEGAMCDICEDDGTRFVRHDFLRQHYFHVHNMGELKRYVCEHCSLEYHSEGNLRSHQRRLHPDKVGEEIGNKKKPKKKYFYKCNLCSFTGGSGSEPKPIQFATTYALQVHKFKVHGQGTMRSFPCLQCRKTFKNPTLLSHHRKEHAGLTMQFKCEAEGCGDKVFRSRKGLHLHQQTIHMSASERRFRCETCGKGFVTKMQYKEHYAIAHLGIRSYICETCGDGFGSSTSLAIHKLIHTGERPHKCPICNQAFRHKSVLQTHIKAHERKGSDFKPNGPMKHIRKRVDLSKKKK